MKTFPRGTIMILQRIEQQVWELCCSSRILQYVTIIYQSREIHYEDVAEGSPPGTRRQMLAPLSRIWSSCVCYMYVWGIVTIRESMTANTEMHRLRAIPLFFLPGLFHIQSRRLKPYWRIHRNLSVCRWFLYLPSLSKLEIVRLSCVIIEFRCYQICKQSPLKWSICGIQCTYRWEPKAECGRPLSIFLRSEFMM